MTINEWAKDFKSYVNALDMPRDDYKGIMEYIDDALSLLKEQNTNTDKEKVIKGLEECTGNGNCTKCQYGKEKQALSCKKLLIDALELIKR